MPDAAIMSRQQSIIHPMMQSMTVLVAGAGMNGSWSAHGLSRAIGRLLIFDGADKVEDVNIGNQAFSAIDVNEGKGEALRRQLPENTAIFPMKFPPGRVSKQLERELDQVSMVVSCVDTLHGRAKIAEWCEGRGVPFIDTRAQGENAAMLFTPPERVRDYLNALPGEDDVDDAPCGMTGGAYTGLWFGSQVPAWVNSYARGVKLPKLLVWHVGLNAQINREEWEDKL